jgi:hypothetical protein
MTFVYAQKIAMYRLYRWKGNKIKATVSFLTSLFLLGQGIIHYTIGEQFTGIYGSFYHLQSEHLTLFSMD